MKIDKNNEATYILYIYICMRQVKFSWSPCPARFISDKRSPDEQETMSVSFMNTHSESQWVRRWKLHKVVKSHSKLSAPPTRVYFISAMKKKAVSL